MERLLFYENKNVIHQQLKRARVAKGLSQSELAAKLQIMNVNMNQQMISKIENNNRIVTDYELACLSVILNLTEHQLLRDFYNNWLP